MSKVFGRVHNPPPERLRVFIRSIRGNGISDSEIRMMANENPGRMLDSSYRRDFGVCQQAYEGQKHVSPHTLLFDILSSS